MQKILLLLALFMGLSLSAVQAQSCTKSQAACCKKSGSVATAEKAHCTGSADAAAKVASLDATIESHTCPGSGTVSYFRKSTGSEGQVVLTSLVYDEQGGKFVDAPSGTKSCCSGSEAACCKSKMGSSADTHESKPSKSQKGS